MSSCCPTEVLPNADATYEAKFDNVYIAGMGNKKGLVFCGDIFGPHPNTFQVADTLAAKGFLVVIPDFFRGKHWPLTRFPPEGGFTNPEFQSYLGSLTYDRLKERFEQAVAILKGCGAESIGGAGFCWGAGQVARALEEGLISSGAFVHASFCTPELMEKASGPVCLCPTKDDGEQLDLKEAAEKSGHKVVYHYYEDVHHGFCAARANFEDETNVKRTNECLEVLATFFNESM
eukprot:CAMPEP_0194054150 /NCGR_PEP_ID=MMETSP0009_2-20130614/52535_1 /TAXON_ID=210454 /ORGANISM="Grammatophora oceanica, Strain CCMP 410" /LENGTH=232 /DNA_ID=CAMNT_0038702541 /DNA_START=57 /DNA_END=755 /DNA_ORIENTATION=-